jgi:hypothetical protein
MSQSHGQAVTVNTLGAREREIEDTLVYCGNAVFFVQPVSNECAFETR